MWADRSVLLRNLRSFNELEKNPAVQVLAARRFALSVVSSVYCDEQGENRQKNYDLLIIRHAISPPLLLYAVEWEMTPEEPACLRDQYITMLPLPQESPPESGRCRTRAGLCMHTALQIHTVLNSN